MGEVLKSTLADSKSTAMDSAFRKGLAILSALGQQHRGTPGGRRSTSASSMRAAVLGACGTGCATVSVRARRGLSLEYQPVANFLLSTIPGTAWLRSLTTYISCLRDTNSHYQNISRRVIGWQRVLCCRPRWVGGAVW